MCIFTRIKNEHYDYLKIKSELKYQKELCKKIEYQNNQLKSAIEHYKKQNDLIRKYKIQIDDLKKAIELVASGEVDDDALISFINNDYLLDALINLKKSQCKELNDKEIDCFKMKPINIDAEER